MDLNCVAEHAGVSGESAQARHDISFGVKGRPWPRSIALYWEMTISILYNVQGEEILFL